MPKKHPKGIGLAETVVAIFILIAGVTSSLSLLYYIFTTTAVTREQIIAINFAREGIELVRNVRDSNWLFFGEGGSRKFWNRSFDDAASSTYISIINPSDSILDANLTDGASNQIYRSKLDIPLTDTFANELIYEVPLGDTTLFTQDLNASNAEGTRYARKIDIEYINSDGSGDPATTDDNIVLVTSTVLYQSKGQVKEVSLSTKLTDWYKRTDHSL